MKTLLIVAHPNLSKSRISNLFLEQFKKNVSSNMEIFVLVKSYKNGKFTNIEDQQKMIERFDKILILTPVYWYNVPGILKQWFDDVFTWGWAYGDNGDKVINKTMQFIWTTGKKENEYTSTGAAHYTLEQFFVWGSEFANFCRMKYLPGHSIHEVYSKNDNQIIDEVKAILKLL